MTKNNKKTTILASLAITAMMLMGLAVLTTGASLNDNDTLGANETATIDMFVGDSFTYTPTTNLTATITASGTGLTSSGGFLTFTSGTLSGTASTAGTYTVVLLATWTSGSLTQTATQTITFNVHSNIVVTSQSNAGALTGNPFSYMLTYTGPSDTAIGSPTVTNANGLSYNAGTRQVTGTPISTGTTTFAWTLSSATSGQSINFTLTINAYSDLAITSSNYSEGYVGGTYSFTVTTSETATIAASGSILTGKGVTWNSPTLAGTFNESAAPNVSPYYTDYQITYTANATISGIPTSAQQTHTLRVYTTLEFTSLPSITNVTASILGAIAHLSATIDGAMLLSVDWGDGNIESFVPDVDGTELDASHEYVDPGIYVATIIAENEYGSVQALAMFDIGDIGGGHSHGEGDRDTTALFAVLAIVGGIILGAGIAFRKFSIIAIGLLIFAAGVFLYTGGLKL